jgi:cyclic pyranopterin phosphate synthase
MMPIQTIFSNLSSQRSPLLLTNTDSADSAPADMSVSSPSLIDNHGRHIDYLRLAVTDRCQLRCVYCRPEEGVPFLPHEEILSFEELERLAAICSGLGIVKLRVTGGEPFARKDCLPFLQRLKKIQGIRSLHITTNGVEIAQYLDQLADLGLDGINLSLDTMDARRFRRVTRRDYLTPVLAALHGIIDRRIPLKINSVVLDDTTDEEIIQLAGLARDFPLTIRFIERMPFSGSADSKSMPVTDLGRRLNGIFPQAVEQASPTPSTARLYALPGYKGMVGIIEGYSRRFCAMCNKIRITPAGLLKTCLYDQGVLDLKKMLRSGLSDLEIQTAFVRCIQSRCRSGHEAERLATRSGEPSMASIGG